MTVYFWQRRKPTDCRRYADSELYGKLQDAGDYNQRFMAQTPQEAGLRFARGLGLAQSAPENDALRSRTRVSPRKVSVFFKTESKRTE